MRIFMQFSVNFLKGAVGKRWKSAGKIQIHADGAREGGGN